MVRSKGGLFRIRPRVVHALLALVVASAVCGTLHAQAAQTISILMLDGKTGRPIIPSNFLVRIDHLNAVHNEWLTLNDDGTGKVAVPSGASFFSIQGTFNNSMEIYVNCDAGMEKDTSTLHWYSISDILSSGVAMPNECYKGKFANATHVAAKPGQFIFFVRKANWHETPPD